MQCTATLSNCRCRIEGEHEVHECHEPSVTTTDGKCHGMWHGEFGSDQFGVVQWPTGAKTTGEALAHAMMLRLGELIDPNQSVE